MAKHSTIKPLKQVFGIGILAGMRSAAAPAIAGHILSEHRGRRFRQHPVGSFSSIAIADVLKIMALGEFLVDKLPFTPKRTKPVSVAVRCLSGALAGAGIFEAAGKKALTGAVLGCVAAGLSTFSSFYLRKALSRTGAGNFISGIVEDAFVVSAGIKLAQSA
ncbi:DUF4126 family protein [Mucilaginibacter auburnensis]|uniref:Putative membrane protein n=1 Tax=Mucilaginibacter auburnensis TaxID=1457233 RepID=A0A2H9VVL7_9SPHI|nr:DUF4126 family protein [Mucilaginibacter auburnensis]PJJ84861.1 putative membrane protein [Mucilaginibacter auburnensis]